MDEREHEELEKRAYFALQGLAGGAGKVGDWRNDLVAVLRSPFPLSQLFREQLATAFDGDLNNLGLEFHLEIKAPNGELKRRQDRFVGIATRRQWMEIGEWVQRKISSGMTRTKSLDEASQKFNASRNKCDNALIYHDRCKKFVENVRNGDSHLNVFQQDEHLESYFHDRDAAGEPLDH